MNYKLLLSVFLITHLVHPMEQEAPTAKNAVQELFCKAVKNNRISTVKNILSSNEFFINLNKKDHSGNTALHIACKKGYTEIALKLLAQEKINLNVSNNRDQSPLDCLNHVIGRNKIQKRHTRAWYKIKKTLRDMSKHEYYTQEDESFECPICYNTAGNKNFLFPATQFCLHMLCMDCKEQCDECPFCKKIKIPR